jgi:hypothetical protein
MRAWARGPGDGDELPQRPGPPDGLGVSGLSGQALSCGLPVQVLGVLGGDALRDPRVHFVLLISGTLAAGPWLLVT